MGISVLQENNAVTLYLFNRSMLALQIQSISENKNPL